MLKWTFALMAVVFMSLATTAAANDDDARRAKVVGGRAGNVVWAKPTVETPYALTGRAASDEQDAVKWSRKTQGRAGYRITPN